MREESENTPTTESEIKKSRGLNLKINLGVLGFFLSLLSLGASFYFFVVDQEDKYRETQSAYRPYLYVTEIDTFKRLKLNYPSKSKELLTPAQLSRLTIDFSLDVRFVLKNIGSAKATLVAYAFTDTTTGNSVLYQNIFKDYTKDMYTLDTNLYFMQYDINQEDTYEIDHSFPITFIKDSTFTIHAMFIYSNERDQLYYTYYTAIFKNNPFEFTYELDSIRQEPRIGYTMKDINESMLMIKPNCYSNPFTKKQSLRVNEFLDWLEARNDLDKTRQK